MKSSTRSFQGGLSAKPLIKSMKKVGSQATLPIRDLTSCFLVAVVGSQSVD